MLRNIQCILQRIKPIHSFHLPSGIGDHDRLIFFKFRLTLRLNRQAPGCLEDGVALGDEEDVDGIMMLLSATEDRGTRSEVLKVVALLEDAIEAASGD